MIKSKSSPSPPTSSMIGSHMLLTLYPAIFCITYTIQSHCSCWCPCQALSYVTVFTLAVPSSRNTAPDLHVADFFVWFQRLVSIDYWEKGNSEERVAREGEETRAQGLGSQLMKELDLFYLVHQSFRRAKSRYFYLHFTNMKMNTQRGLENWPRIYGEQRAEAKLKSRSSYFKFKAL